MHASMLEIYNEHIRDLLDPDAGFGGVPGSPGDAVFYQPPSSFTIQHDASGNTTVQDLTIRSVSTREDIAGLMAQAAYCRSSAGTDMNATSSRSHCVFTLRLYGENRASEGGGASSTDGVLHLIDLAGSERLSRRYAVHEKVNFRRHPASTGSPTTLSWRAESVLTC